MNKLEKDIELTQDCIKHWIRVRDKGESSMARYCALCVEYGSLGTLEDTKECIKCPIREDSGSHCEGTPYYCYSDLNRANDMIKYLEGLLKKLIKRRK